MQVGAFMQVMDQDARTVSQVTGLTLQMAGAVDDPVVHHLLVGHLEPRWERRFIHDSYACRRGKGTHRAVERLRAFTRQVTANGTRRAWYLQRDVRGFFITLDRHILYQQLTAQERDPAVHWLLRVILFQDLTTTCRFRRARRADFERLPPHKTLFKAKPGCGLPIGNLTSQFFANVYLDPLDQFVKHRLKARYYLRYCDDLVLLSADQSQLEDWERQLDAFLAERLHLQLNERRKLRRVGDGIDFLGDITRPDYLLVRRRVVGALQARLNQAEETLRGLGMADDADGRAVFPWPWPLLEELRQWLSSYFGHLGKASSHRLLQGLRQRYPWLDEYVQWEGSKVVSRCPVPRHALRLAQQHAWFATHLPGHVLLIRQGDTGRWSCPRPPAPPRRQSPWMPSGPGPAVCPGVACRPSSRCCGAAVCGWRGSGRRADVWGRSPSAPCTAAGLKARSVHQRRVHRPLPSRACRWRPTGPSHLPPWPRLPADTTASVRGCMPSARDAHVSDILPVPRGGVMCEGGKGDHPYSQNLKTTVSNITTAMANSTRRQSYSR